MELTTQTAKKAAKWFCKSRGIEDWTIKVLIRDALPPEWLPTNDCVDEGTVGLTLYSRQRKIAVVWVSPGACEEFDPHTPYETDPWDIFFHECCHVWARSIGIEDDEGSTEIFEQAWHADGEFFSSVWQGMAE